MSTSTLDKPISELPEKLLTLHSITWEQFKVIEAQLENNREVRLTYFAGVMEIMSPIGEQHERVKKTLSYLVEAYMKQKGIRYYGCGGYTLEEPGYASGTPDESYCIGTDKAVPDIVLEIIVTSGSINRRELYKPKRVPEVWFWQANQIRIFHLREDNYQEVSCSEFFPELDIDLLLRYLGYLDQYDAVNEFTQAIGS